MGALGSLSGLLGPLSSTLLTTLALQQHLMGGAGFGGPLPATAFNRRRLRDRRRQVRQESDPIDRVRALYNQQQQLCSHCSVMALCIPRAQQVVRRNTASVYRTVSHGVLMRLCGALCTVRALVPLPWSHFSASPSELASAPDCNILVWIGSNGLLGRGIDPHELAAPERTLRRLIDLQ